MTTTRPVPGSQADAQPSRHRALRGRPEFYTSYGQDLALFNTPGKRAGVGAIAVLALAAPFGLEDPFLALLALCCVASIGAIGLNLVTGFAGQVSLGHAFFLGIGAYTAASISGDRGEDVYGLGITFFPVWLLAAGLVAGLAGLIVAPLATRLRGLYLAIVTLGLVLIGAHFFNVWDSLTGGPGIGRPAAEATAFGFSFDVDGEFFTREQKLYLLMLGLLIVFAVLARNLMRSSVGRAFAAVRDRDIAAEIIGVDLRRTKRLAFAISSFYAGCAGALLYTITGFFDPGSFSLLLSVQYIAMVLIGGAATISGSIMGAFFITLLPTLTRELPQYFPFISPSSLGNPNVFQVEAILYGLLIIGFLIFEPRGLFGIWIRVRSYWKSWPFSY